MATFESFAQFNDFKDEYKKRLKQAMALVKKDAPKRFVYYTSVVFEDGPKDCLLVDFLPKALTDIVDKDKKVVKTAAEGIVSLTDSDEYKFEPQKGQVKAAALQKLFNLVGVPKAVHIPADEREAPVRPNAAPPQRPGAGAPAQPPAGANAAGPGPGPARPMNPLRTAVVRQAPSLPPTLPPPARRAPPKPSRGIGLELAGTKTQQVDMVSDYMDALKVAKIPVSDAVKNKALADAKTLFDLDLYPAAMHVLNDLSAEVEYTGVEPWVLDPAQRKYYREHYSEEVKAFVMMIEKREQDPALDPKIKAKLPAYKKTAQTLELGANRVCDGVRDGVKAADPVKVKTSFAPWDDLVKQKEQLRADLKEVWLGVQEKRFNDEVASKKDSQNQAMAAGYGKEAMLELAMMAETLCVKNAGKKPELAKLELHKKLDASEMAGIYGYSTADYTPIGQQLRKKKPTDPEQLKEFEKNEKKFEAYIKAAEKGLGKLPKYKGDCVRCTGGLWPETISSLASTGRHTEASFMSVGTSKVPGFGDIEWHFEKTTKGADISMFSLHDTEGEILFPPGSKWRLLRAFVTDPDGVEHQVKKIADLGALFTPQTRKARLYFAEA